MVAAARSIPEAKVLRRSGYQTLERQAAPSALPNRHVAKRARPPSVRVKKVSRAAWPIPHVRRAASHFGASRLELRQSTPKWLTNAKESSVYDRKVAGR
jgi:hypothetical protein